MHLNRCLRDKSAISFLGPLCLFALSQRDETTCCFTCIVVLVSYCCIMQAEGTRSHISRIFILTKINMITPLQRCDLLADCIKCACEDLSIGRNLLLPRSGWLCNSNRAN